MLTAKQLAFAFLLCISVGWVSNDPAPLFRIAATVFNCGVAFACEPSGANVVAASVDVACRICLAFERTEGRGQAIDRGFVIDILITIVVATVHGYLAAWLAVRMLFRPRYPVKLFGVTIWPQGMIPRHRQRLAETIGRAVGEELVSEETVTRALFETGFFRRKIESFLAAYADEVLNREYDSVLDHLPPKLRVPVLDAISALQRRLAERVASLLQSPEMMNSVRAFVERRADELLARRLHEVFDDDAFAEAVRFMEERFSSIVREPGFEARVHSFVQERFDELIHSSAPLAELVTPEAVAILKDHISRQMQPIAHQLAEIATSGRTRTQIGALIKREVDDYYAQLSLFKKIFISRERIHREVDEMVNDSLPRRIDEYLRGEAFAHEAVRFLHATIDRVLQRPINELVAQIAPDKLAAVRAQIAARILAVARSPEVARAFGTYAQEAIARLRPHTLRALLQHVKPDAVPQLKERLAQALFRAISRPETAQAVNAMINAQIERLLVAPIGRLNNYISDDMIKQAAQALAERIVASAQERLPATIKEFDVGGIVRRKVSDYPVEKLEELVLSVSRQHLRTIELFGLVIGFVIGVVQAAYLYVRFFWMAR